MSNMFFTSDPHFGHKMVAELRGFDSVAEHDEAVMTNLAAKVKKQDDQLWILGDLALGKWREALMLINSLPGHKHLIIGNHDQVFPGLNRDSHKYFREYMTVFSSVQLSARGKIAGKKVILSHFPYRVDHSDPPRWLEYRHPDFGDLLIHGHTHSAEIHESPAEFHVGLDAWNLEPVSQGALVEWAMKYEGD